MLQVSQSLNTNNINVQTSDAHCQRRESSTAFSNLDNADDDDEQVEKSQPNIITDNMSISKEFITYRGDSSYGLLPPFTQFRKQVNIHQQNQSKEKV